ncbi:MAG: hypothetical protein OHK0031_14640 [Anaerolineales bacterium]
MKVPSSKPILTIFILLMALTALTLFSFSVSLVSRPDALPNARNGGAITAPGGGLPANGGARTRGAGGIFSIFGAARSLGLGGQIFRYIGMGFSALELILLGVSAYGVWRQKRFGLNLAMLLAIFILLGALPGLFFGGRFFNFWNTARSVFEVGAAVTILALGILPSVRDTLA